MDIAATTHIGNLDVGAYDRGVMSIRPHIMITAEPIQGLQCVDDLRMAIQDGRAEQVWHTLLTQADGAVGTPPLTPSSPVIGRPPVEAENANRDWIICHAAGQRVLCGALAAVVTGDRRYADDALVQIRALLDEQLWPDWRDRAHLREPIDLRTGMLAHDIALAYDWLYPLLRSDERQMIVAGLEARAIQPFWEGGWRRSRGASASLGCAWGRITPTLGG